MKKLYIAYTGGTIGMRRTTEGTRRARFSCRADGARCRNSPTPRIPSYTLHEYDPLLDSSNMRPADWVRIGRDIVEHYDEYDGFIVLHGTDTMAYTASRCRFSSRDSHKPVIITGSQIPLSEVRNDARINLITSMMIAAEPPVPEVTLYFGNRLLRGCRATKVNAEGLDAFDSPNYPPLAIVGVDVRIDPSHLLAEPRAPPRLVEPSREPTIGAFRLFPGVSSELMANVLQPPLQGLVLLTYGVGNGPDRDAALLQVIREASDRGVVIVACTQCLRGSVHLGEYATGAALARAGVISGFDMTTEAALCKLYYLFSTGHSRGGPALMGNLCGELTLPPSRMVDRAAGMRG